MEFFPKKKKVDEKEVAAKAEAKLADYVKDKPGFKEEAAAQEGDISDYVMPFKGALKSGGKSAAKAGLAYIKSMGPPNKEKRPPKLTDYSKKEVSEKSLDYGKISKEPTAAQTKRNIKPVELQYEKGTPNIKPAKDKAAPAAPAPATEKKGVEVKYIIGRDKDGKAIYQSET